MSLSLRPVFRTHLEPRQLSQRAGQGQPLKLHGIDPASVWYLLFEALHRYDAIDHVTPWEPCIYSRLICDEDSIRL